jgi:DNA polymerase III alpha subunit (gram-positive type)
MRYLCLDFETNGFSERNAEFKNWTLPFSSYPVQLSVHAVEDGEVSHLYETVICGATSRSKWVQDNIRLTLEEIANGIPFHQMIEELAALLEPGDVLVAHNASFDIDMCIATAARRIRNEPICMFAVEEILATPRFCTMKCAYSKSVFGKQPKMQQLCDHFEVELVNAHDAAGDSLALAKCVKEAVRRGVML